MVARIVSNARLVRYIRTHDRNTGHPALLVVAKARHVRSSRAASHASRSNRHSPGTACARLVIDAVLTFEALPKIN
jgi:hypothetical protein